MMKREIVFLTAKYFTKQFQQTCINSIEMDWNVGMSRCKKGVPSCHNAASGIVRRMTSLKELGGEKGIK